MSGLLARIPRRRASRPGSPGDRGLANGAAPGATGAPPGPRKRARMRRRLRVLRALRGVQLRDLGGLVFEQHRAGRRRDDLVAEKVVRLGQTDRELHALEHALHAPRPIDELREAGLGGMCPRCGEVFGFEARFCSACGQSLVDGHDPDRPA